MPCRARSHRFLERLSRSTRNSCEVNRLFGYLESTAQLRGLTLAVRLSVIPLNSICGRQQLPRVSGSVCHKVKELWSYLLRNGIFGSDLQRTIMMGPTKSAIGPN